MTTTEAKSFFTQERLRELFDYNPETGALTWRVKLNKRTKIGKRAGTRNKIDGYRRLNFNRVTMLEHLLIVCYMTGQYPPFEVDHINGVCDDNRWSNLRLCVSSQNHCNAKIPKHNTSGFKNVYFRKQKGWWMVDICFNRQHRYLFGFKTAEEANVAAIALRKQVHGEFARDR